MAESKTKLAQALSSQELHALLEKLQHVPHGELASEIQRLAAEEGIIIGRSAAYEFKNKEALPWMKRLDARKEKAKMITDMGGDDSGRTLADAAAAELGQIAFDFVGELDGRIDFESKEGRAIWNELTKGVKRIRDSDRAMIKQLRDLIEETKEDLQDTKMSEEDRASRMRARFGV